MASATSRGRSGLRFGLILSGFLAIFLRISEGVNQRRLKSEKISRRICMMCLKSPGIYTCNRCNAFYCSMRCYNDTTNHAQCLAKVEEESMNRVRDNLKGVKSTPEARKTMMNVLQREEKRRQKDEEMFKSTQSEMDGFERDLAKKLGHLDLEDDSITADDILAKLPKNMQNKLMDGFQQWITKGAKEKTKPDIPGLEQWLPYWLTHSAETLTEIDLSHPGAEKLLNATSQRTRMPSTVVVTPLRQLKIVGEPDTRIRYHILSMLLAYAYVTRLENGWHQTEPASRWRSSEDIIKAAPAFRGVLVNDLEEALHRGALECSLIHKQDDIKHYSTRAVLDVAHIVLGKEGDDIYTIAALSDMINLFNKTQADLAKPQQANSVRRNADGTEEKIPSWLIKRFGRTTAEGRDIKEVEKDFYRAQKKCEFCLAWVLDHGDMVQELTAGILDVYKEMQEAEALSRAATEKAELSMKSTIKTKNSTSVTFPFKCIMISGYVLQCAAESDVRTDS
ncbi:hypothetical protein AAMO2058_000350400 [Amorphochlora amoebiformis]